ncbi:MAG: murein biosynthesis integral membrane protein MurJ [Phycisphaerales bacterium]|nr:MAG: murein biosynthesis integral membrane protein MurJ [Phycisphaerales bacterium]
MLMRRGSGPTVPRVPERPFLHHTRTIALLTLVSRIMGLVRDVVFANYFGAGSVMAAFRVAFVVPNLSRRVFGEGALSAALVPIVTRTRRSAGDDEARRLAGAVLAWQTIILAAITLIVEIGLSIAHAWAPSPVLELTRLLLPYMVLICAAAAAGGILNACGRFALPALAPVILNVAIIAATAGGAVLGGLTGMGLMRVVCVAVLVSGAIQFGAQWVGLGRAGLLPRWNLGWKERGVDRVVAFMAPMVLGLSAVQLSTLLDHLMAISLVVDEQGRRVGPAVLAFAQNLYQLPLGVFGIALATAVFPKMAALGAAQDRAALSSTMSQGLRLASFVAVPAAAGLVLVSHPLVQALFERNEFQAHDSVRVSGALVCYALGLPAYFANHVLVRAFYALGDSRTPVRIVGGMVAINVVLGLALVLSPLQERGLALATAISAWAQTALLGRRLHRVLSLPPDGKLASSLQRTAACAAAMAAAVWIVDRLCTGVEWLAQAPTVRTAMMITLGAGVYVAACRATRHGEFYALLGVSPKPTRG